MHLSDKPIFPARGVFSLLVYRAGLLVERFEDDNLIVDQSRENIVHLLGGDGAGLHISKIGFGVGGATAIPENTALTTPFLKAFDGHSYPTKNSIRFNFSLGASEANGMGIQEFGLITESGLLHARKVRGGVLVKDADLSLSGTWQLFY